MWSIRFYEDRRGKSPVLDFIMTPLSKKTFKDWQQEQLNDPEFLAAARKLEPGYQIARLRILRGLTQAQLAERVGTHQPSIARLENGSRSPSISFLERVAQALDAKVEVRLVPEESIRKDIE